MFTNISLFVLGLAIGLLVCSIYNRWQDKQFMDLMVSNHEFLIRYAEIADRQYDNLSKYVNDQTNLLCKTVHHMLEISQQMSKDNTDNSTRILGIVKNDHEVQTIALNDFTDFIKEHEKINEERWGLIVDYITNDGPERADAMRKQDSKVLCDWCKNQQTEKCIECYEAVSSKEVYFVNYEAKEEVTYDA